MSSKKFSGIPAEAFEFYEALAADPTKAFWDAHKARYLPDVRAPQAKTISAVIAKPAAPTRSDACVVRFLS